MPTQFLYSVSSLSAFIGILGLVGIVLWLIIRKQTLRLWLPVLQVLRFEQRKLPKLRLIPPPWVSFLLFLALTAVLAVFSLRPANLIFTPFDPKLDRHHILFDLSASGQASNDLITYVAKARSLYNSLNQQGKVTVSSSAALDHVEITNETDMEQWLQKLRFHPYGAKLGSLLKAQLEGLGDIDRLYVISDGDQASWNDFNWRFLSDEMDVIWVPLRVSNQSIKPNVFFWDAYYRGLQTGSQATWEVELARTSMREEMSGELEVKLGAVSLQKVNWRFPAGRDRVSLAINWVLADSEQGKVDPQLPLSWHLSSGGSVELDDHLLTPQLGRRQQALVIGEPSGERFVDDALQQLRITLDILGFKVKKVDHAIAAEGQIGKQPLIIAVGGTGSGLKSFCPVDELKKYYSDSKQLLREMQAFWLAPYEANADYRELCQCYAALTQNVPLGSMPTYCEDVSHRDHWVNVLSSLGAKQVGGGVGEALEAIAWRQNIFEDRLSILAFTAPLRPSVQTGINFATLPALIRSILQLEGFHLGQKGEEYGVWSRIDDIGNHLQSQSADAVSKIDPNQTNVPVVESQLRYLNVDELPAAWVETGPRAAPSTSLKQDNADPIPWIRGMAMVAIGICALEGLWLLSVRLRKTRKVIGTTILFGLAILFGERSTQAQVAVTTFDFSKSSSSLTWIAREVSSRTSIDMQAKVRNFTHLEDSVWQEPWLWVYNLRPLSNAEGELSPEVLAWIRRGGFLILDGSVAISQLEKLTSRLRFNVQQEGWRPIPTDHELLRSFHLLESLPHCDDKPWMGFQFDSRLAILVSPFSLLKSVSDEADSPSCMKKVDREQMARIFINLLMAALATDYKKDQIHLPEILKRLR